MGAGFLVGEISASGEEGEALVSERYSVGKRGADELVAVGLCLAGCCAVLCADELHFTADHQ